MSEQWIQQMRQKMADYKRPAPEVSWEEIDRAVAANKTRQARLLWLRRIAAAAVLLLITGVGYWGLLRNDAEQAKEKPIAQQQSPTEDHRDNSQKERQKVGAAGIWHSDSSAAKIGVPVPVMPQPVTTMLAENTSPISASSPDTIHTAPTEEETLSRSNRESNSRQKDQTPTTPAPVIHPTDFHQRKHIDNRLTAKVYMSSTMAGSQINTNNQQINRLNGYNTDQKTRISLHHHQPVRFGFSLRYLINDRWSIESGLSYTRLSSDISTTVDDVTTVTEQHLNYIGLPLNISYDLWKSSHFGLYVTASGTIDKRLDASPWQFSLTGAAGAEYRLTNRFSLYAEPGLGYYFKDGSTTPTIYQDRPLIFNLSVGLRFNFK